MKNYLVNQRAAWRITLRLISKSRVMALGLVLCVAGLCGCASMNEHSTESFLTAAGFQRRTPSTPQQKEIYARMTPYRLRQCTFNGKALYAYKDEKQGVIYFGNEQQYQEYQRLMAQGVSKAEQMNESWQIDPFAWGLNL